MPTARAGLAAAAVNGKIYTFGGSVSSSQGSLNTVEVYDPGSNSWSVAVPCPPRESAWLPLRSTEDLRHRWE